MGHGEQEKKRSAPPNSTWKREEEKVSSKRAINKCKETNSHKWKWIMPENNFLKLFWAEGKQSTCRTVLGLDVLWDTFHEKPYKFCVHSNHEVCHTPLLFASWFGHISTSTISAVSPSITSFLGYADAKDGKLLPRVNGTKCQQEASLLFAARLCLSALYLENHGFWYKRSFVTDHLVLCS